MALIARSGRVLAGSLVGLVFLAGCAAGPAASDEARAPRQSAPVLKPTGPKVPRAPAVEPAGDWESFSQSGVALRAEIDERADAMNAGPIGSRGVELASLRLAASGRDLIDAGSLDGALEALQRAISLYGRNGYAYLFLAYVHHVQGRGAQAAEFAASAGRYLPQDAGVRAELEGLTTSIREGGATAAN